MRLFNLYYSVLIMEVSASCALVSKIIIINKELLRLSVIRHESQHVYILTITFLLTFSNFAAVGIPGAVRSLAELAEVPHFTAMSSLCPQSAVFQPLWGHWLSVVSVPLHATSSSHITPLPGPNVLVTTLARAAL